MVRDSHGVAYCVADLRQADLQLRRSTSADGPRGVEARLRCTSGAHPWTLVQRDARLCVEEPLDQADHEDAGPQSPSLVMMGSAVRVRASASRKVLVSGFPFRPRCYLRMFTARATTITASERLIADCISISIFAQRLSGIASVGLNAIELVNDT